MKHLVLVSDEILSVLNSLVSYVHVEEEDYCELEVLEGCQLLDDLRKKGIEII